MNRKKDIIYLDRWLEFHPYSKPVQSDFYYPRLCNEAFGILKEHDVLVTGVAIHRDELMQLACFIVSYFEDVISGPGLWRTFTNGVWELYGKYIPFFDSDPDDYYPDEINLEDIQFLLRYFVSMRQYDESVVSPGLFDGLEVSFRLFDLFEEEY
jgi:hypothetical protein